MNPARRTDLGFPISSVLKSPLTLVTGASGFIGWHVARLLTERGHRVRALCRPASKIHELDVERVTGDVRDPATLAPAVKGCDFVFHLAADYRLWSRDPQEIYQSNVDGTRNMLEAACRLAWDELFTPAP